MVVAAVEARKILQQSMLYIMTTQTFCEEAMLRDFPNDAMPKIIIIFCKSNKTRKKKQVCFSESLKRSFRIQ